MASYQSFPLSLFLLLLLLGCVPETTVAGVQKADRQMIIRNHSGRRVELNWIHPQTKQRSLMTDPDILHGAEFTMNSYVSHAFELRELPSKRTKECLVPGKCKTVNFAVNHNDKQVIDLSPEFSIRHEDHKSIAKDVATNLIDDCTKASQSAIANTEQDPKSILDSLTECMSSAVEEEFIQLAEEISFQATLRKKMAESYENYTCADFNLTMSPSLENTTWYHAPSAKRHDVKILLDQPASRVHVIDNFVSQDQCDAMADAAKDRLQQAVVGDGSGGHELSKSRKALQAGIRVPWNKEKDGNPIATLSRKVYDYVNHATGLDIDEHGQEDLMSIQYFGRGMNDTEPDHYKPHCDGECTGDPHKNGTRVATIVMYCTIPEKGGATNFRNVGLHVVPEVGRAVFFSYMNPDDHLTDPGLTEHSGCPVIEGEKKIVTQWVRHGVTKEVPWNMYNSLGLLKPGIELDSNGVPKERAFSAGMWNDMAHRFTQSQQASAA